MYVYMLVWMPQLLVVFGRLLFSLSEKKERGLEEVKERRRENVLNSEASFDAKQTNLTDVVSFFWCSHLCLGLLSF